MPRTTTENNGALMIRLLFAIQSSDCHKLTENTRQTITQTDRLLPNYKRKDCSSPDEATETPWRMCVPRSASGVVANSCCSHHLVWHEITAHLQLQSARSTQRSIRHFQDDHPMVCDSPNLQYVRLVHTRTRASEVVSNT